MFPTHVPVANPAPTVGMDRAILDLPTTFPFKTLKGWLVGLSWRSFETWRQVRARCRGAGKWGRGEAR